MNKQREILNLLLFGVICTAVVILVMGLYELLTFFMNEQMALIVAVIGGAGVILATFIGVIGAKAKKSKEFRSGLTHMLLWIVIGVAFTSLPVGIAMLSSRMSSTMGWIVIGVAGVILVVCIAKIKKSEKEDIKKVIRELLEALMLLGVAFKFVLGVAVLLFMLLLSQVLSGCLLSL